ncbi:MAG TPA: NosD domain-containing protein, partial [Methanothermobacter thermautotrophicus]|nr:NosD domain-containing protein [Methanothermobacter thermautotrophicus]
NNENGIHLPYGPKNNSITNNTITNNTGHGILLEGASNNTLSNNTVVSNTRDGIILLESCNNTLSNNIITSNRDGIALGSILGLGSSNNTIRNNIISRSTVAGIGLWASLGNWFVGNYFINNTQQITGGAAGGNFWNTTEGGNYWSDYGGDDLNGDGTGDSPYSLISGPLDYKPLIVDLMINDITTASNIIRVRVKNNGKADMTRIDPDARFPVKISYGTQEFIQYINPLPGRGTTAITQRVSLNLGGVIVTILYNATTHYLGNTSIRDANIRNNRASCIGMGNLVNASSTVKSYYERHGRLPSNVKIMGQNYSMAQLLYLLCRATVNINAGNLSGIIPRAVGYPTSPGGSYRSGNIHKSEYVRVARNIINFINRTGKAPNYAWTGRGRIPFQRLTYMYTKIIRFYGKYNTLPKYVYI